MKMCSSVSITIYLKMNLIQYKNGGSYEFQEIKQNKNWIFKRTNGNTSVP